MVNTFRIGDLIKLKKSCKPFIHKAFNIETPALVSKSQIISGALRLINGLKDVKSGDKVLIKPNINSDDIYPGTTRVEGLVELIRLLKDKGVDVSVGDMSSAFWHDTRTCADKAGILKACKEEDTPLLFFEDYEWDNVKLPNTSLTSCYLTSKLCDFDHLVNLCVLKTHRMADFTLSMKNLMGCLHLRTRMKMHTSNLKTMIGEFQRLITPVINIVDGTKCFIDGGPDKGELREPGLVFASKDRIALDVTCIRALQDLGSQSLKNVNPWMHPQIIAGIRSGIGIQKDERIKIIT
ncbi:Uncharacterised protein [Candidatus Tiddalikarchaeum anstoanum]|nr:Uncharacterised protein [Candidatus Tiddalikarchaeum anstoanum]